MKNKISVISAVHLESYTLLLEFNDGKKVKVNFEEFLFSRENAETKKYRNKKSFQKFHLEHGELMWGDYEMLFPIADLYNNSILKKSKPIKREKLSKSA
jgi:Protein of unknown function (DUF2442)